MQIGSVQSPRNLPSPEGQPALPHPKVFHGKTPRGSPAQTLGGTFKKFKPSPGTCYISIHTVYL